MYRAVVLFLIVTFISNCKSKKDSGTFLKVDTISTRIFLSDKSICDFALAKDFKEIKPVMIPWATDSSDPYSEAYIIEGKKLTILQPLKRFDLPDSSRKYFYDEKEIMTTRVLFDSLTFDFSDIVIDYGITSKNIFQNQSWILLRNQPVSWNGLANRYRFIQLFDLKRMVCYEFFVDYSKCLETN